MLGYVKPKIVLLDDDESLLKVIEYYFKQQFNNSVLIKAFSKSVCFFDCLEECCFLPDSPYEILTSFYKSEINKESVIQCLEDLSQVPAIIVLDQELRGENLTGIDISLKVRQYYPNSHVTMLTSTVTDDAAIKLHNDQNIDLFVDKKSPNSIANLYSYLAKHIAHMNQEYQVDPIDVFKNHLIFKNKEFIESKNLFLQDKNPVAYVTLNHLGSLALMNEEKEISFWTYETGTNQFINYEY